MPRRPYAIVGEAVREESEGLLAVRTDVCGEPVGRLGGQDTSPYEVDECAMDTHQGVRGHVRRDTGGFGRAVRLGGESFGEGGGGVGDRLLFAGS